jgi:hypothetical protein
MGTMPEKNGSSDQPLTKENQNRKTVGQQWNKRPTMRYLKTKEMHILIQLINKY